MEEKALEAIKEKVRSYLLKFYRKAELLDDQDIFELGFVNSLFSMQLIMFIEKEFGISIDNEDLDMDNFKSVNSISDLIQKKMSLGEEKVDNR